jgi:PleD family two-component response regulator
VTSETPSILFAFPKELFEIDPKSETAPMFYYLFSHVLAAKLRISTVKSLFQSQSHLKEGKRVKGVAAIIDESEMDRMIIEGILQSMVPTMEVVHYKSIKEFTTNPTQNKVDLFIVDPNYQSENNPIDKLYFVTNTLKIHNAPICYISDYCSDSSLRAEMISLGAEELLEKPFSIFDVKHVLEKFKSTLLKEDTLQRIEMDAETDGLTGLSNRRKLDSFLSSLLTFAKESSKIFSILMIDVDNFKHFNDTMIILSA